MIRLKNKSDLIQIRKAIRIGEVVLKEIEQYIDIGITTLSLNNLVEIMIASNEAFPSFKGYKGFPFASCMSINEEIIHGLPNNRKLKDGDILKIDVGINYNNYFSDQARTYLIGEPKNYRHYELINTCKEALAIASYACKSGNNLTEVSKIIYEIAKRDNFCILKDYSGHGVGFEVHEEPQIPNHAPYIDLELKSGMVLAIEPMFVWGEGTYKISNNGWTIISDGMSSHEECTVIIK